MRKLTTEQFIERSKKIHGEKYDYSKSIYKLSTSDITITCRIHGDFKQKPKKHFIGHGCQICGGSSIPSSEDFIKKAIKLHGERYQYSSVNYFNANTPVAILCNEHGGFFQTPTNHLGGSGCPSCAEYGFKRNERVAYVYFLDSPAVSAVKIGITHDLNRRIKKLTRDTPFNFNLIKSIKTSGMKAHQIEKRFQQSFLNASLVGFDGCTEWLVRSDRLIEAVMRETPP